MAPDTVVAWLTRRKQPHAPHPFTAETEVDGATDGSAKHQQRQQHAVHVELDCIHTIALSQLEDDRLAAEGLQIKLARIKPD